MKGGGRERNKAKSHPGGFCLIWHYRSLDRFRTATVPLAIEQFQCATVQQWQYQILCHRQQQSLTPYDTEAAIIGFHCTFALVTIESLFVSERQCAILLRICDRPVYTLKPDYWLVDNTIFTLWLWQTVVDSLLTVRDVFFRYIEGPDCPDPRCAILSLQGRDTVIVGYLTSLNYHLTIRVWNDRFCQSFGEEEEISYTIFLADV